MSALQAPAEHHVARKRCRPSPPCASGAGLSERGWGEVVLISACFGRQHENGERTTVFLTEEAQAGTGTVLDSELLFEDAQPVCARTVSPKDAASHLRRHADAVIADGDNRM